jgi:hypothetical protein
MIPSLENTLARMQEAMSSRLEEHCSHVLIKRLHGQLEKISEKESTMEACLTGIRTALRLFVDEQVAEDLHKHLTRLAKADGFL